MTAATENSQVRIRREGSVAAWLDATRVLTWRQLLVYVRDVVTVLQSVVIPAISLVLIKVVLGTPLAALPVRTACTAPCR